MSFMTGMRFSAKRSNKNVRKRRERPVLFRLIIVHMREQKQDLDKTAETSRLRTLFLRDESYKPFVLWCVLRI